MESPDTIDRLEACLIYVATGLKASWLRLKPSKTKVKWLKFAQQLAKVQLSIVPVMCS